MGPNYARKVADVRTLERELEILLQGQPARLRIGTPGPGIVRLRLSPAGDFTSPVPGLLLDHSPDKGWADNDAKAAEGSGGTQPQVSHDEDTLEVGVPGIQILITGDPLHLVLRDSEGVELARGGREGSFFWTPAGTTGLALNLEPGTMVLGMGEKTGGLERRGRRYTFWNTDVTPHLPDTDPLYASIPFWITLRPWGKGTTATGWFLLATGRSVVDAGKEDPSRLAVTVDGELDLFIIAGPRPADVLRRYTALTGRMPLPPLWALGHQHSRWGHGSASAVLECAREFRRRRIPCDVLYLDIDHMDGYRVFTWDPVRFPNPETLCTELAAMGFRLVTIVDPGVKADSTYALYREGLEGGHFVTLPDGTPFHGEVWPGRCAFPDFFNEETRRWWGEHVRRQVARGVAGIWNDMNEPTVFEAGAPTTFPPEAVHRTDDGCLRPHRQVHNLYGFYMARATYEALAPAEAPPDTPRPFTLTRSGFAGVQRYAALWTGDNSSWWEHLASMIPMLAGLGLSGLPFVGVDVGGFSGDAEGELLARWYQAAALTPLFRNHSAWNTRRQEPWAFGPEVEAVVRRAVGLRYRLLPYLYGVFEEAARTGVPILRPLLFEYPDDADALRVEDEYLVGSELLVAPVVQRAARQRLVYLPAGSWMQLPAGPRLTGRAWHIVDAPLESLPLFARAGAVLPLWPVATNTGAVDRSTLELEVIGHDGSRDSAVSWLYEDDGETLAYRTGAVAHTRVSHGREGNSYVIEVAHVQGGYQPPRRQVVVRLHLPASFAGRNVEAVLVDDHELPQVADLPASPGLVDAWLEPGTTPVPRGRAGYVADTAQNLLVVRFPNQGEGITIRVIIS